MTTLLFTTHPDQALDAQLSRLDALPVLSPFSPQARDFVAEFARRVLRLSSLRQFPELATLAHWFRPAARFNGPLSSKGPRGSALTIVGATATRQVDGLPPVGLS